MSVFFGCGSWADAEYSGLVYPRGARGEAQLSSYAKFFPVVEVNSSYYATPRADRTRRWAAATPPEFRFEIKLHRAFSRHPGKIAREGKLLPWLVGGTRPLVDSHKLGAYLLVLSENFHPDTDSLDELAVVARALHPQKLAVELRHNAWVAGARRTATLEFFRREKLVWVATDFPHVAGSALMPFVGAVTNPQLAYLRLHGRNPHYMDSKSAAEGHDYEYADAELDEIILRVRELAHKAADVHVFANNHARDLAPRTALRLAELWRKHIGLDRVLKPRTSPEDTGSSNESRISGSTQLTKSYLRRNPKKTETMAKSQNSRKETKKTAKSSPKDKKAAKSVKKSGK